MNDAAITHFRTATKPAHTCGVFFASSCSIPINLNASPFDQSRSINIPLYGALSANATFVELLLFSQPVMSGRASKRPWYKILHSPRRFNGVPARHRGVQSRAARRSHRCAMASEDAQHLTDHLALKRIGLLWHALVGRVEAREQRHLLLLRQRRLDARATRASSTTSQPGIAASSAARRPGAIVVRLFRKLFSIEPIFWFSNVSARFGTRWLAA